MKFWLAVVVTVIAGRAAAQAPYEPPADEPTIEASIRAQNDVPVPGEVEGVLMQFPVREGSQVKLGQMLATIDDRQAKAAVEVAQFGLDAAREKANDKVEEKYARAAAAVAKINWQRDVQANQEISKAVPEIQIRQKKLEFDRSILQIEKAGKDQVIAGKEADVKGGELKAARIALDRRTILAPFDGEVQQLFKHQAEWVNPGDPILRLVQFDVMYVEGYISARQYDPVELQDRPVTVHVILAREREEVVEGRIDFVNQTVLGSDADTPGEFLVRAQVTNQRQGNIWLLRPGLRALMTIHVKQPPVAAPAPAPAPAQSASSTPASP